MYSLTYKRLELIDGTASCISLFVANGPESFDRMFKSHLHPGYHQRVLHRPSFYIDFKVPANDIPDSRPCLLGTRAVREGRKLESRRSHTHSRCSPNDRDAHDTPILFSKWPAPKRKSHLTVTGQHPPTLPTERYSTWLIYTSRVPPHPRQLHERRDNSRGRPDDRNHESWHRVNVSTPVTRKCYVSAHSESPFGIYHDCTCR